MTTPGFSFFVSISDLVRGEFRHLSHGFLSRLVSVVTDTARYRSHEPPLSLTTYAIRDAQTTHTRQIRRFCFSLDQESRRERYEGGTKWERRKREREVGMAISTQGCARRVSMQEEIEWKGPGKAMDGMDGGSPIREWGPPGSTGYKSSGGQTRRSRPLAHNGAISVCGEGACWLGPGRCAACL